jgi:GWxTD domain-containing protein
VAVLAAALGGLAGCTHGRAASELQAWSRGPVRWLMLPEEERALATLRGPQEVERFVGDFWRRRDPALAAAFAGRVDAADRLYAEDGPRGALSDRGRTLILLGPPPVLRTVHRPVPSYRPERAVGPRVQRMLRVEVWVYPLGELPDALRAALAASAVDEVAVSFALEPDRTRLLDGDQLLELARHAFVREPPMRGDD